MFDRDQKSSTVVSHCSNFLAEETRLAMPKSRRARDVVSTETTYSASSHLLCCFDNHTKAHLGDSQGS